MKQLVIVIPNGENNLSSITGAHEIFSKANAYQSSLGQTPLFEILLAGTTDKVHFNGGLFTVQPHVLIAELTKPDLIIVPSLNHNYDLALENNQSLVRWLIHQYNNGAEIATICTGAFMLADSGLLDGRKCSTHWSVTESFRSKFPKVNLQPDQLITDENGIYTNGGAYSFLNLMLYLIEKYYNRATAIYCSKVFQIEIDRNAQSEFSIFSGQKKHDDNLVLQAQEFLENNLQNKIATETLSAKFNLTRRTFDRRFIKATGNTPIEYSQRLKIEAAKKAFETHRKTVSEVMFEVGYSDHKAFREIFRRFTGLSPLQYKEKYHKQV